MTLIHWMCIFSMFLFTFSAIFRNDWQKTWVFVNIVFFFLLLLLSLWCTMFDLPDDVDLLNETEMLMGANAWELNAFLLLFFLFFSCKQLYQWHCVCVSRPFASKWWFTTEYANASLPNKLNRTFFAAK